MNRLRSTLKLSQEFRKPEALNRGMQHLGGDCLFVLLLNPGFGWHVCLSRTHRGAVAQWLPVWSSVAATGLHACLQTWGFCHFFSFGHHIKHLPPI